MMQRRSLSYVIFSLLSLFVFSSLAGCQHEVKRPQYSVAVRPKNIDEASQLRAAIKRFANSEGFLKETQAGNEAHLEKNGMYLLSFYSTDTSYISFNNIVDSRCYGIAIYSSVSASVANAVGGRLDQVLRTMQTSDYHIAQHSSCNASNPKAANEVINGSRQTTVVKRDS